MAWARGGRRLTLLTLLTAAAVVLACAAAGAAQWSAPATLGPCAAAQQPLIAFPYSHPEVRTGPGAIIWAAGSCDAGGEGVRVSPLDGADRPGAARPAPHGKDVPVVGLVATGTTDGQIVIGGRASDGSAGLLEGPADGRLRAPGSPAGPASPVSAASGYIGDAAIATLQRREGDQVIVLRVQRHYAHRLSRRIAFSVGATPVGELLVTLDFRSEALLVWTQGRAVYAREVGQTGIAGPVQKLGEGSRPANIQGLISDDYHAIVAWETQESTGGQAGTAIHLSISALHVRFGSAQTVASFGDPAGVAPAAGSLRLVRLSTERVVMGWTAASGGAYSVRASGISLTAGVTGPVTVSGAGEQAMLDTLATGPHGDVLAVWSSTPLGGPAATGPGPDVQRSLVAARGGFWGAGAAMAFEAPLVFAPPGANGLPSVAIDPGSDRAVAAWVLGGASPRIAYSIFS